MKLKDMEKEMKERGDEKVEADKTTHLLPESFPGWTKGVDGIWRQDPRGGAASLTPHRETSVTVHWPGRGHASQEDTSRRTFDGGRVMAPIGTEVLASYADGSKAVVVVDEDGKAQYARQSKDGHLGAVEDDDPNALFQPLWSRGPRHSSPFD